MLPSPSYLQYPLQDNASLELLYDYDEGTPTIGTEEKKFWFSVQVNQTFLDAWTLSRDKKIDDGLSVGSSESVASSVLCKDGTYIDVLLEAQEGRGTQTEHGHFMDIVKKGKGGKHETYAGRMVPLAPPSGISLFLRFCVEASP